MTGFLIAIAAVLSFVVWWWLLRQRSSTPLPTLPHESVQATTAEPAAPPSRVLRFATALWIALIVVGGYVWVGTPGGLALGPGSAQTAAAQAASQPAPANASRSPEEVATLLDQLAARMKQNPSDPEGWAILGRASFTVGRLDAALEAFAQATRLRPDDAELLADYANALGMKNQRQLAGEPTQLIDRALKADPNSIKALALSGMAAMQRKDPSEAVLAWERLVKLSPPDSPVVQALAEDLKQARQMAAAGAQSGPESSKGKPAADASPAPFAANPSKSLAQTQASGAAVSTTTATSTTARITGTVSLSAALKNQVAPDDTVFVYARAIQGPRMPLALVRKKVADLPFDFVLDDASAMSPAMRLSSATQVEVLARISKTGQAQAQSGDAQVMVAPVALGAAGVALVISTRLP
jgi:cytochrome c-type biogenesis protein CcmH